MIFLKKVLAIVGPTAVGKTSISINLAKKFHGEIINGDSVQVYKGLDIGSAKITPEEMSLVPHHLLDIKEPGEFFSVAEYQELVRNKINEISERDKLPIIVGGTAFYIHAALYDFRFIKEEKNIDRDKYANLTDEELHQMLIQIDEKEALKIHPHNRRRVLRALQIYENNRMTKSEFLKEHTPKPLYDILIIGLDWDRKKLYERINQRVDMMLEKGLLKEVEMLYHKGIKVDAIGYKEFDDYFLGLISLDEVNEKIKQNTRHYAKRQLTYFRNKLDVKWFDVEKTDVEDIYNEVSKWLRM